MPVSGLQWSIITLYFVVLLVWIVAISYKSEHSWANNPWLPTMTIALLWGVWIDSQNRGPADYNS